MKQTVFQMNKLILLLGLIFLFFPFVNASNQTNYTVIITESLGVKSGGSDLNISDVVEVDETNDTETNESSTGEVENKTFYVDIFQGINIIDNLSYVKFVPPPPENPSPTESPVESKSSQPKYWIWWIVIGFIIMMSLIWLVQSRGTYLEEEGDDWEINEEWKEIDNKDDGWGLDETENEDF